MTDTTARTIGTVGIWLAVAVVLTFGVFRADWNGTLAMLLMLVVVALICAAATISTALVWAWRPSIGLGPTPPEDVRRD